MQARTHLNVPVFSRPNMSTHSFSITCSSTQHHIAGSAGRSGDGGGITALFSPPMSREHGESHQGLDGVRCAAARQRVRED